jgi:Fe2+ or Zn2+ uptake regulation protein
MCTSDKSQIARQVLSYLSENAGAQDTFEGIVEWWLLQQRIKLRAAEVREALDELAARKLIVVSAGRDSRTRYHINRRKVKAIRALLEESKGDRHA